MQVHESLPVLLISGFQLSQLFFWHEYIISLFAFFLPVWNVSLLIPLIVSPPRELASLSTPSIEPNRRQSFPSEGNLTQTLSKFLSHLLLHFCEHSRRILLRLTLEFVESSFRSLRLQLMRIFDLNYFLFLFPGRRFRALLFGAFMDFGWIYLRRASSFNRRCACPFS